MIRLRPIIYLLLFTPVAAVRAAAPRPLDTPVEISIVDRDNEALIGRITDHDAERFAMDEKKGGRREVAWSTLPAGTVFSTYQRVMDTTEARSWLGLGELLMRLPDGFDHGDRALQVAVLLDPSLAERAAAIRAAQPTVIREVDSAHRNETTAVMPDALAPDHPETFTWNDVTPQLHEHYVRRDKALADDIAKLLGVEFNLVETDYFLFYTDLSPKEAYEWQRVLDLMYERVSYLLEIPRGVNVFKGKALVFLFTSKARFVQFEKQVYDNEVTYAAGICHQHPTGEVRIAFHRIDDDKQLRQMMIHEAAHGVVHRYRSPRRVAAWINEGIAEWTALSVVNYKQPFKWKKRSSAEHVKKRGRLGFDFFIDDDYQPEHYGTSLAMIELLLRRGRPKFIAFIAGIKDGKAWEDSLQEHYDMSPKDLVKAYGQSIGIRHLKQ